ncbi:MAG TPA: hypothetical protein DIC52_16100 [Candidatus Latescibacteria bacterium]|nr:hypothetical protein [Candidatus Latescibacterota bacterium]
MEAVRSADYLIVASGASAQRGGFHPWQYIAYRPAGAITIDGKLNEASWLRAPATDRHDRHRRKGRRGRAARRQLR